MIALLTMVITCAAARTARACTTFLAWHAGEPVVGKSYDWNQQVGLVTVNPRGLEKKALVLDPMDKPATWVSKYGSLTFNQYGVEFPNGGLNEQGLAIEIMWLESSQYPAADDRPVTNELQWIQRSLDLFATVDELARDAPSVRVSPVYGRVHYLACDAQAECAAFEYLDGELLVTRGTKMPAKTLTNDTYPESASTLSSFEGFGGTEEMPDSPSSLARFVRASMLARTTEGTTIPDSAFAILKSVETPFTVWSIVYGLKEGMVHFRTWNFPSVKRVRLPDFSLACGTRKVLDIETDATGDVGARFVDYSQAAHRDLLTISMTEMAAGVGEGVLDMFINYPDSVRCSPAAQGSPDAGADARDSDRKPSDGCSCSVARATHPHPRLGAFLLLLGCAVRLVRRAFIVCTRFGNASRLPWRPRALHRGGDSRTC